MSGRRAPGAGRRLVHVVTVPLTLGFLRRPIRAARSRGYEVAVVSSPGPRLWSFAAQEGVEARAVPMARAIAPLADLEALAQLRSALRDLRPDIVHAHTPKAGLLGMMAAASLRVPARLYHLRGLVSLTAAGPRRVLLESTERVACTLAHHVLCVGPSLRDLALEAKLTWPAHIEVLRGGSGQGVDVERFQPASREQRAAARRAFGVPEGARVIAFVGRLVGDKGVRELTEAFASLAEARPDLHLLVAGAFEDRDPVPAAVRQRLEAHPRIHRLGHVDAPESLYAAADLVALPTYREGFPNVPLEAAAMGLPVVATQIPGCVDAVAEGVTGLLVPAKDTAALAVALARYLDDEALRRAHGEAGRARVCRDFRADDLAEAIVDVYDRFAR
ncbi:MAG: glycosyltransferase family 4 protein [Myxococcota bacterium]